MNFNFNGTPFSVTRVLHLPLQELQPFQETHPHEVPSIRARQGQRPSMLKVLQAMRILQEHRSFRRSVQSFRKG